MEFESNARPCASGPPRWKLPPKKCRICALVGISGEGAIAITNGPRGNPDEAVRWIAKIGGPAVSARVQSDQRCRYFGQICTGLSNNSSAHHSEGDGRQP